MPTNTDWDEYESVSAPKVDSDWDAYERIPETEKSKAAIKLNRNALGDVQDFKTVDSGVAIKPPESARSPELSTTFGGPRMALPDTGQVQSALGDTAQDIHEFATRPAVPIPRFTIDKNTSIPGAILKSGANLALSIPEFLETPAGATTAALAPVAPILTALGFTGLGAENTREAIVDAGENWNKLSTPEKIDKAIGIGGAAAMTVLPAAGAIHGIRGRMEPQSPIPDLSGRDLPIPEGYNPRPVPQLPKPEVPETPAEPQKGMTVLEEIRNAGAKTKEDIRKLYPQLTREQAAQLRNQAWGEPAAPIVPDQTPGQALVDDIQNRTEGQSQKDLQARKEQILAELDKLQPVTTRQEAWLQGAPELEGQTPWSSDPKAEALRNELYEINGKLPPEPAAPTPPDSTDQLINAAQQGKFSVTPEAEALIQDILGQSSRDSREVETKPEENPISAQITQKLPEAPEDLQSQLDAEMGDSNVAEPKPEEPVAPEPNPSAIDKAEQWANDKLKGGGTSSGPDVLAAYAVKGAITIARGIKDFGEWSAAMLKELGEAVRPHLQDIWERVKGQESPEAEAERVSKMSADEFNKFTPPGTATKAGYELAKRLGADGDKTKLAEYEKATVAEMAAAMKKAMSAAKEDRDKIMNDGFVLGVKKQYFNEAQRMMTAMGDVERGMSLENAGRKNGLQASELEKYASKPGSTGLAKNVRNVSGATGEGGFLGVDMANLAKKFKDGKDATVDFTKQVTKETMGGKKMNDLRKSVLDWSAKLQRSFGESSAMQKDLLKQVPDIKTRQGIVNWIQADGDTRVLTQRLAATADKHLAEGYRAALALTPEQIRVANQVKAQYADLAKKANHYDLLNTFKDNYVTQLWDLKKGPTGGSSSRTLRDKFRFAKASTFPTYFDGEQAGFTPKGDKDIAKILPVYMHEMNTVIAARQLVEQLWKGKASDGRPLLAPIGVGVPVDNASGHATLVMPKAMKENVSDYKVIPNQPALSAWRFAAKDSDGRPVMLKSDLAVHPEAVGRLKAILGRSAIREWYDTPTSATAAIPKAIVKGIDQFQSVAKGTMLGLLAPFHQVQEGTHGVGHRVNPTFGIPKIDLVNDRGQMDAARHGLMLLPDRASEGQFMEGLRPSGLVSHIPVIGPLSDHYSNYLFHEYIPGLKYKTYSAILERNNGVYAKDLRSGSVTPADIKVLSAEQTNAAYGHLNYADLARNPTLQHIIQLMALAPDFFEARARFTGQAIKGLLGGKAGREQLIALGTLAVAQAALAYTSAKVTGGEWDKTDPFSFKKGNRRYTMRSVPEDLVSAGKDSRGFIYSRINPITMKGLVQGLSGTDYRGKKVTLGETAKELAQTPIPITAKGFLGIGNTSVSAWESLAGAVGLKISRDTTSNDVHKMALDWMSKSTTPKVVQAYKDIQQRALPESIYKPLKMSVENGDSAKIIQSVKDLLAVEPDQKARDKRKKEILREFNPFTKAPDSYDVKIKPFATRSKEFESAFIKSLDEKGKESYRQSVRDQVKAYRTLTQALYNKASDPKDTPELYRTK